jgi:orotidine-5'-phosphate decarboxylase
MTMKTAPHPILIPISEAILQRVIVALDTESELQATEWVRRFAPHGCCFKIGAGLVLGYGLPILDRLREAGAERLFLDLKFHDIPNSVAIAVRTASRYGVWMLTLHASGGKAMMEAAREAVEGLPNRPLLMGVTVLTSLSGQQLAEVGMQDAPQEQVLRLAALALQSGMDGVIASPKELSALRAEFGEDPLIVTPGIRLPGSETHDQQRTATPEDALKEGANYLVMGRSLTELSPCHAERSEASAL